MRTPQEIATAFAPQSRLESANRYFLVGIGGAGMSALARMLKRRGKIVLGTDGSSSPETDRLLSEGIDVSIGHSGARIQAGDAVILSDAIDLGISPEVAAAKQLGCPILRRSQLLGWLVNGHKVIAVTGTHGKTTTTGMVGAGLISAGLDPLIVVGASIPEWGSPVVEGQGEWAAVEACEAYNGFLDLQPTVVVLTNLELDHVDFHGTYDRLRGSVLEFVNRIPSDGALIYCVDDEGACDIASRVSVPTIGYSSTDAPSNMALPGAHNSLNAAGALRACVTAGATSGEAAKGIKAFGGAERRLQVLQEGPVRIIDDYAHHPTEVAASLQAIKGDRVVVVFQPHLYSRTAPIIAEFAEALSHADEVVLTDIYPAREAPMAGVSSARIAELITKPVHYVPSRHLLPRFVAKLVKPGDTVVGMGAGTIGEFAPALIKELARIGRQTLNVTVVHGGDSAEREVSLHSGIAVSAALERKGHVVSRVDVSDVLLSRGDLSHFVGPNRPDIVFLAVHGTNMEDGAMQGLLEILHVPYTGSGIQASALAMDKAMTKQILGAAGIRTPKGVVVRRGDPTPDLEAPLVVKPNSQGSTVGLTFVEHTSELASAIERGLRYDDSVLVEEWLQGVEISVPVLVDRVLLPVEIVPATGRYDFASKYLPGATTEICPARLSSEQMEEAKQIALRAHAALGCVGATRTDMIVRDSDIIALEVNTLPGMTPTSLLPNSAKACGIEFDDLVETILQDAWERYGAS